MDENECSDASTDCLISSPVRKVDFNEADKQILEWAGKLELESVDLREKAGELTSTLKRNSDRLYTVIEQLNKHLKKMDNQNEYEEIRKMVDKIDTMISVEFKKNEEESNSRLRNKRAVNEKDIMVLIKESFDNYNKIITKKVENEDKKVKESLDYMSGMVFEFNHQLENVNKVLYDMSVNLKTISDKQVILENKITSQKKVTEEIATDMLQLQGTTLDNGIDEEIYDYEHFKILEIPSEKVGAITRSKANKISKRRATTGRHIIPWDELNVYYSSEL